MICKFCKKKFIKKKYANNKTIYCSHKCAMKNYRETHKEELKVKRSLNYQRDKKDVLKERKQYYKDNRKKVLKYKGKYYKDNISSIELNRKKFRENGKCLKYDREYYHNNKFIKTVQRRTSYYYKKESFCEICKSKKDLQWHHWRYRLPLQKRDFNTLCKVCHLIQHKKNLS